MRKGGIKNEYCRDSLPGRGRATSGRSSLDCVEARRHLQPATVRPRCKPTGNHAGRCQITYRSGPIKFLQKLAANLLRRAVKTTTSVGRSNKDVLQAPEVIDCKWVVRAGDEHARERPRRSQNHRAGACRRAQLQPTKHPHLRRLRTVCQRQNRYGGYTSDASKIWIFSLDQTKFLQMLGD